MDLRPLPMRDVPAEVAPLVESINQLIDNQRHKGESQQAFLANASHQLRTPLTRLQTQLELLANTLGEDARQRIVPLMETSRQLSHFTRQMLVLVLMLARSARDADLSHEFQPTDLAVLLEEAAPHFLDAICDVPALQRCIAQLRRRGPLCKQQRHPVPVPLDGALT